jgi:nicotinate-nucleotide adenylyltransferase
MQIALFGGRFDPVHNGHLAIAREILKVVSSVDEVWFVPDNQHHWNPTVASVEDRFALLHLVEEPNIKVSDIGIQVASFRKGKTFVIDIIRELQKKTKNTYLFIAGSDQITRFHEWIDYDELLMRLPFLIFPRKGYVLNGSLPHNCLWLSDKTFIPLEDSATRIREKLKKGESIAGLVSKKVEKYIKEHRLYV